MKNRLYNLLVLFVAAVGVALGMEPSWAAEPAERPNIIFILSDDLGYGDLGCYGQKQILTPAIDRMAREGMRFTDCYAGSTVCAPSRCTLMTGLHTGHARIRGNADVPLTPQDVTVAEVLRRAGYATGLIGKWGLGESGTAGIPNRQGFDSFFGYLNQAHAHNYYPDFLWRNEEKVPLKNVVRHVPTPTSPSGVATQCVEYSHDLFASAALQYIEQHKADRFFLYLAFTIPHANNERRPNGMEVPSLGPYANKPWPAPEKGLAAMISRMDADVERLMAKLRDLGLDHKTIVFFSSDNGPHHEGGCDPAFFQSSGPLQGFKRSLHDGGIREPMIVRWPGHVRPQTTSDLVWAFWDFLPTAAELVGVEPPAGLDGISVAPTLLGRGAQKQHEFLYWEFHERPASAQAARMGPWKAVRESPSKPIALYDLRTDIGEAHDVAAAHPEVAAKITAYLNSARTESKDFPLRVGPRAKKGT